MRFVHDAKDDFRVVLVFRSELRPQAGELLVGGSALGDDSSVPSGVVVHVEDDEWVARLPESRLNGSIISREELRIDCATNGGCHQLPRKGNSEYIHALCSEVRELTRWRISRVIFKRPVRFR